MENSKNFLKLGFLFYNYSKLYFLFYANESSYKFPQWISNGLIGNELKSAYFQLNLFAGTWLVVFVCGVLDVLVVL